MLVLAIGFITWVDPLIALISPALFGVGVVWSRLVLPRLRQQSRSVRDELGRTSGTLSEFLGANTLLKAFNAKDMALEEVGGNVHRVRHHSESLARTNHRYADPLGLEGARPHEL
jgi:ABC-type multidrug transport system fused ATPase/permease subunit